MSRHSKNKSHKSLIREWVEAIVVAILVATCLRWLALEHFAVPTPSMEATILTGDHLLVSKLHYGARTPITPLQIPLTHKTVGSKRSYLTWIQLPSYRLPSLYEIKKGDIVVFNFPMETETPIDLREFYIKRCVGLPGDTLEIKNSYLYINNELQANYPFMQFRFYLKTRESLSKDFFLKYNIYDAIRVNDGYILHACEASIKNLQKSSFIKEIIDIVNPKDMSDHRIYPASSQLCWNSDFYGPIIVPQKGKTIEINKVTLALYKAVILYHDGNKKARIKDGKLFINDIVVKEYTFKQDYYFMMGDNRHNSLDSRYWGFVPYDHVVGKAVMVLFSRDITEKDFFKSMRWKRTFKML
jgi:signal peptidase I